MKFLGGKQRIAKHIVEYLNSFSDIYEHLYEPFAGSFNVGIRTNFKYVHCSDIHPELILMWKAIKNGWQPPVECSEQEYKDIKYAESSALKGFYGFASSFSGKWFGDMLVTQNQIGITLKKVQIV